MADKALFRVAGPTPRLAWPRTFLVLGLLWSLGACGAAVAPSVERGKQAAGERAWQDDQIQEGGEELVDEALKPSPETAPEVALPALGAAMERTLRVYRRSLDNAARRDRELNNLVRRYLSVTREVFSLIQLNRGASGVSLAASYDPVPAWRFQARAAWELRTISARAEIMRQHLRGLARAWHLGDGATASPRSRAGRLNHYDKVVSCIQVDVTRRALHGLAYLRVASVRKPALDGIGRAQALNEELKLMRGSVRCATLAVDRYLRQGP